MSGLYDLLSVLVCLLPASRGRAAEGLRALAEDSARQLGGHATAARAPWGPRHVVSFEDGLTLVLWRRGANLEAPWGPLAQDLRVTPGRSDALPGAGLAIAPEGPAASALLDSVCAAQALSPLSGLLSACASVELSAQGRIRARGLRGPDGPTVAYAVERLRELLDHLPAPIR